MPVRRSTDLMPAFRPTVTQPSQPAHPAPSPTSPSPQTFSATPATSVQAKLSELRTLMRGHMDRKEEARALDVLKAATPGELNQLFTALSREEVHELFEAMDDRLIGPDHRTAFVGFLTKDRLGDLGVESRAKVVQALQSGSTEKLEEQAITNVFLGTRGEALTQLKNLIDGATDHRDLQELLFHDLDSAALRAQVLKHFAAEAPAKGARVKVLSDIDDTFYVNWKDDRFPKKTVYPGVRALYAELDKGASTTAPDRVGDLMFLSARPYDRAGVSEHFTRQMMFDHGVTQATVLSGDFAHLLGNDSIATKKYENWEQVRQLYPEYGSVFLGDSGQGDAIFGAKAAATSGGDMRGVLIHNVTHLDAAAKADFARQGVVVFDTYVGAAVEAYQRGLISKPGLQRVVSEATREFDALTFASPEQKAARRAELDADLARAAAV